MITLTREEAQQVLDALEYHTAQTRPIKNTNRVIEFLRARLAKPLKAPTNNGRYLTGIKAQPEKEQEPVAWMYWQRCLNDDGTQTSPWVKHVSTFKPFESVIFRDVVPLYTAPPQRPWVGLTEGEIIDTAKCYALGLAFSYSKTTTPELFARAIEAKLKEKNT